MLSSSRRRFSAGPRRSYPPYLGAASFTPIWLTTQYTAPYAGTGPGAGTFPAGTTFTIRMPSNLYLPAGANPGTPIGLWIHGNGAGQRDPGGTDANRINGLMGSGLAQLWNQNLSAPPAPVAGYAFLAVMETSNTTPTTTGNGIAGVGDPLGSNWAARAVIWDHLRYVLANYNIDRTRIIFSGYSSLGEAFCLNFPLWLALNGFAGIPAGLVIFDANTGVEGLTAYTSGTATAGNYCDLLTQALYPITTPVNSMTPDTTYTRPARAVWERLVGCGGQIPRLIYNSNGSDALTNLWDVPDTGQTGEGEANFVSMAANGQVVPSQILLNDYTLANPLSPSQLYAQVKFGGLNHAGVNPAPGQILLTDECFAWGAARKRSDYPGLPFTA